jgi:glycerol-3-phosphate acyltransferase PlsY
MSAQDILVFLACYLLGALPFSVWIGKAFFKTDVRQHGSGNPGATNMLRTLGPGPAVVVLLLDIAKGAVAVLLAHYFTHFGLDIEKDLGGFLAVLGHMYSPFLGFKGGKGVATTVGVMCLVNPIPGGIAVLIFLLTVIATAYVSLGSVLMVMAYAILTAVFAYSDGVSTTSHIKSLLAFAMAGLVIYKHRSNIQRLASGTENKLRLKKNKAENK